MHQSVKTIVQENRRKEDAEPSVPWGLFQSTLWQRRHLGRQMGREPKGSHSLGQPRYMCRKQVRGLSLRCRAGEGFRSWNKQFGMLQFSPYQSTSGEYRLRTEKVLSIMGADRLAKGPKTNIHETILGSVSHCTIRRSITWQIHRQASAQETDEG